MEEDVSEAIEKNIKRVIIIGNGAAGIEAARTIREKNKSVEILMFFIPRQRID